MPENEQTNSTIMRRNYSDKWKNTCSDIIFSADDYMVGISNDGGIIWETSTEYDKKGPKDLKKHDSIMNDATLLATTPCDGLSADMKHHFKRLVGEAMVCSFAGDYDNASKMLKAAGGYVLARSQEASRRWYLSSSFAMTVPFVLAGAVIWLSRDAIVQVLGANVLWLIMAASAGSLGALLSVITRTGKLKFDCSAGRCLHWMEGTSRIWAGAISAVIVALAVQTEMLLAPLSKGEKLTAVMMLAALAAGASERLATSIISTIGTSGTSLAETSAQKKEKTPTGATDQS